MSYKESRDRLDSYKSSKRIQSWGVDMQSSNGIGRRVFVKTRPNIDFEDLLRFFRPCKVEGMTLTPYNAAVQFERPSDVKIALGLDRRFIGDTRILVEEYKPPRKYEKSNIKTDVSHRSQDIRKKYAQDTKQRESAPDRHEDSVQKEPQREILSITNQPSREFQKSQLHQPLQSQYRDSHRESSMVDCQLRPSRLEIPAAVTHNGTIQVYNHLNEPLSNRSIIEATNEQLNLSSNDNLHQPVQLSTSFIQSTIASNQIRYKSPHNNHRGPPLVGDLPGDVELTLKLVIQQKTAKNLSIVQIRDIMTYFEHAKNFVTNHERLAEAHQENAIATSSGRRVTTISTTTKESETVNSANVTHYNSNVNSNDLVTNNSLTASTTTRVSSSNPSDEPITDEPVVAYPTQILNAEQQQECLDLLRGALKC